MSEVQPPNMGAILSSQAAMGGGAGATDPKVFDALAGVIGRGWAEAGIGKEHDVTNFGLGGHGLAEIFAGAGNKTGLFSKIWAALFNKDALWENTIGGSAGAFKIDAHAF